MKEKKTDEEAIGEVYLRALARPATNSEIASGKELLAGTPNRTEFYQDLLWAADQLEAVPVRALGTLRCARSPVGDGRKSPTISMVGMVIPPGIRA